MLAKELKIKTLKKQRKFIEDQLSHADFRNDGDTGYWYVGHICPEVIAHFEAEGFTVKLVHSDLLTAINKGNPTYFFTACDVKLTAEELQAAEEYEPKPKSEPAEEESDSTENMSNPNKKVRVMGMPSSMFGGMPGARPSGDDAIIDEFLKHLFS